MFKIGDFSRLGQVSVRTLRHYDELGLIKPYQVDPFTEYRYYTIEQLPRLHRILALKDLGLPLEQIADLLQKDLPREQLQQMLQLKQEDLRQQIQNTQDQLNRLSARLRQLEQEGQPSPYDIVVKSTPACCIVSARHSVPSAAEMPKYRGMLIRQLYTWLKQQKIKSTGYEIVLYHMAEYAETNIDMEFSITLPDIVQFTGKIDQEAVRVYQLPAIPRAASVVHSGMIQDVPQAIAALFTWIDRNGYNISGAIREIHLFGPETVRVRDEPVVIELQVPIELF